MSGRLWVDSSVLRKVAVLRELTKRAAARGVPVSVHAHVHLEMCRHLRSKYGAQFSPSVIQSLLEQRGIRIESMQLDEPAAERWAERLHRRYPSDEAWEEAKHSTLGGELSDGFEHEPGKIPMTTDWWVALQVEDEDEDRVAVDDKGGEWQALREVGRAMNSDEALEWLQRPP